MIFTLSRKSLASEWQVLSKGQPVLSFREGLLAYTKEVQNKELEADATQWINNNYPFLADCYVDARRHLLWEIDNEWKWQVLITALRYGIDIDDPDDAEDYINGELDNDTLLEYIVSTIEGRDVDSFNLDLDEDIDIPDLCSSILMLHDIETDELLNIIKSFYINRTDEEKSMPDDVFADLVVRDWAQDLLWWNALVDISPRQNMGNTIAHIRKRQGITQEQLAKQAGITLANVRNIEAGKYNVNIDVLSKIATALGDELVIMG